MKMVLCKSYSIRFRCPNAGCQEFCNAGSLAAGCTHILCTKCNCGVELEISPALVERAPLTCCVICGGREFFMRKDFPQRLGLSMVILFAALASVTYYYQNIPATFAILGALVLIDAVIYVWVGKVTVCYRCRAEYRGIAYNPDHKGFDLATSEKYPR